MAMPTTAAVELYLRKVRQGLAFLPAVEKEDIIAELRSYLFERQNRGSDDPLEGFDPAETYVAEYALCGALA